MELSFAAIHRICDQEKDKFSPSEIKAVIFLSDGRALSDEQLVEKLESFGIKMNKDTFLQTVKRFLSAEEMFYLYFNQENVRVKLTCENDEDWLWICLEVLWERWAPAQPSFEMIDELMQDGYDELGNEDQEKACDMWLKVWKWILKIMDERNLKNLDDFDDKFRGTQSVWNWVQDLEMELGNAGCENLYYLKARIEFTGEYIKRFSHEDKNVLRNMKRAFAESHFRLGESKTAGSLFEEWLEQDPRWGWGWIGYSDYHWLDSEEGQDFEKGEEILKRGLAVPEVEDREDIIDRLVMLYDQSERPDEAEKWMALLPPSPPLGIISKVKHLIPSKKRRKKKKKSGKNK